MQNNVAAPLVGSVSFQGLSSQDPVEFAAGSQLFTALNRGGSWFVVWDFTGRIRGWRFTNLSKTASAMHTNIAQDTQTHRWWAPAREQWRSSLDEAAYQQAVRTTRNYIRDGAVYQANICRVLSTPLATPAPAWTLHHKLALGNPAPYGGYIQITAEEAQQSVWLVSASPEMYLRVSPQPAGGALISSSPIKGTAPTAAGLTAKDRAENTMITDLLRNDISQVTQPGTVAVSDFLQVQEHPGLVHLVSTVSGFVDAAHLRAADFWERLFAATFPPGSVSGAPKHSALQIIDELETHPRGPYCGGFGWIDADRHAAELAVGIRSFWWDSMCEACGCPALHFGTGAGITWGSDPEREWAETELKAQRLLQITTEA